MESRTAMLFQRQTALMCGLEEHDEIEGKPTNKRSLRKIRVGILEEEKNLLIDIVTEGVKGWVKYCTEWHYCCKRCPLED